MIKFERQCDLFNNHINFSEENIFQDPFINKKTIKEWHKKIIKHQSPIFKNGYKRVNQTSFFESDKEELNLTFNPMQLTALPLSFWRFPKAIHEGKAIYFVMDNLINCDHNIILYIGETISAEKRWKGEHDCKNYLSTYSETLQKAKMKTSLNIRFWLDVPVNTKERRRLEQKLIQLWLPPFNKETRDIWATPFTSQIN